MNCRLDRLWPLAWLKSGAVSAPFPRRSHDSDNVSEPSRDKNLPFWAQSDLRGSIWHPKRCQNRSKKGLAYDFSKKGKMRSARAGAVQTLILSCNFDAISATMRVGRRSQIDVQNTYVKYATFCTHWNHFGCPGCSQRVPWAIILPSFSDFFARLGRMISQGWFRRPVLTEKRPSRHTNQQFRSQNNLTGTQIV